MRSSNRLDITAAKGKGRERTGKKKKEKENENGHKPSSTALDRENDRSNMEITGGTFARFEGTHDDGAVGE